MFYEKLNSTKLKWNTWVELVLIRGCLSWVLFPGVLPEGYSLVDGHPGTKGSEELQVKIASSAAIGHMGSVLIE